MEYDIIVRALPDEKGGGYIGLVPDLQGCSSDGDTPEEALANTIEAMNEWLDLHRRRNRPIPEPGFALRQAKERHDALLRAINVLSSDLNNRLDDVEAKIRELQDVLEKLEAATDPKTTYGSTAFTASVNVLEICH